MKLEMGQEKKNDSGIDFLTAVWHSQGHLSSRKFYSLVK